MNAVRSSDSLTLRQPSDSRATRRLATAKKLFQLLCAFRGESPTALFARLVEQEARRVLFGKGRAG
ncbi:hypothetical protein C5748_16250 [Phyllobacterium phragmitis]|uniref:Uncharacterized protein n=1 Tax=Phyllobacterium phragmitis TaxID=2670329 RepID=A0A2S9IPA7_9HYPH|nr:hypothetical protein [Phyllobacterium phragmitis]PRD42345.1 hypothetical protein C5748_16250 [Phyllobacterium phragmitis]